MRVLRKIVFEKAYDMESGRARCHHCGGLFTEEECVEDHFPHARSTHPELKYDENNMVNSDWVCNGKESLKRAASIIHWEKTGLVVPVWERS